jgi:23S rRNA pseudouridine2605 synthase
MSIEPEGQEDERGEEAGEGSKKILPPRREERLQKIMAAAGIASRRKSEELILSGRVRVNGQIVTELDGKLLQGSQKHRYFMLNKPKGFVTTVSDPENRPTIMKFFERAGARVYPVGRLDYQSEGLLLVTNDGDLANRLTKASSKVEKTYLVKISGKPTENALNQLRGGIMIDRGKPGRREGRVLTQPASIRLVRDAENPWYEVILTEGRNRQLRKLFEEIGHFVEKIRRVGYGPLVLDVAPGEIRELSEDEVLSLQRASVGVRPKRPAPLKIPKMLGTSKRGGTRPSNRPGAKKRAPSKRGPTRKR